METEQPTIAAIATAIGGGVGVIRLSGKNALAIANKHFTGLPTDPAPRHLYHGWFRDSQMLPLDEGLCAFMKSPNSYTGEDVIELHLHGGLLSLNRCMDVLWKAGVQPAGPGDFTRRAFLNGKMDLTRAEAVADMIAARTHRALNQARSHLHGQLATTVTEAREKIIGIRARIEVNIDFVEEDVPLYPGDVLAHEASDIGNSLEALANTFHRGRLWRDGARVVLVGHPNAGKSSLFNTLCGHDRAIVTATAGTTRDTLEETIDIAGIPVLLVDTAGLRETDDEIETAGMDRTKRAFSAADLVVVLKDRSDPAHEEPLALPNGVPLLQVDSKVDLQQAGKRTGDMAISTVTGQGIEALKQTIAHRLGGEDRLNDELTIGRQRHQVALQHSADALTRAAAALADQQPPELAAVDIQEAADALAELVGATTNEDVLDRLFSSFCIGK